MANEWTTEYPKVPGYYWLRNSIAKMGGYECLALSPYPYIVEICQFQYTDDCGLRVKLIGESIPLQFGDFIRAEWFGPIPPPQNL